MSEEGMLQQNRKDVPEKGRKYRLGAIVEVLGVDQCTPPCVQLKNSDDGEHWTLEDPHPLDWTDLGPVLEEGYYQDSYGHFWHYYPSGADWQRRGPGMVGVISANGTPRPVFPVYRVEVDDTRINE